MADKKLVAYFSASGVTAKVAKTIADAAGAELFEIKPVVPYTSADQDWTNSKSRSSVEMNDLAFRPPIAERLEGPEEYGVVYLGFPIWWYIAPTIINTFLEAYDFSDKTIVLFATSGGSGFGKTVEKLRGSVSGTTRIIEGKLFNGALSRAQAAEWLGSLGV